MAGSPPKERTHWRLTFRRLAADALAGLRAEDSGPAEEAGGYFDASGPVAGNPADARHSQLIKTHEE